MQTTTKAKFMKKLLYERLYSLCLRNMACFKTVRYSPTLRFSRKYFDVPLHPYNAYLLCAPLTIQFPQLLYRRFSAELCSNLLPGYNVVLVADLQKFRKYGLTIALLNLSASSLFFPLVKISHAV